MKPTKTQLDQAKIEELRGECPKVKIDAWYDASGGPGTGKWKIRGSKNNQVVIAAQKESLLAARDQFRAAYHRAVEGNLL